jgi:hypothetical protein
MKYSDIALFMSLGDGVVALGRCGLAEGEAKAFLLEAIEDGRVRFRRPSSLGSIVFDVEATDWEGSHVATEWCMPMILTLGCPAKGGEVVRELTAIKISRDDVAGLCGLVEAEIGACEPAARRGRKSHGETRDVEILQEIDRMIEAGEISVAQGQRTAAAEAVRRKFPTYQVDTIRRFLPRK